MRDAISLRALTPDDWEIFRSARLNALKQHPEVYLSSYEAEAETPEVKWKETLNGNGKCVVALFDNDRLIGFAAVFTWRGDPTGKSGVLAMDYIEPTYRGRGLSRLLYQGRIDWALDQKQFARLVISQRQGNEASRRANQAFGFEYQGREKISLRNTVMLQGSRMPSLTCEAVASRISISTSPPISSASPRRRRITSTLYLPEQAAQRTLARRSTGPFPGHRQPRRPGAARPPRLERADGNSGCRFETAWAATLALRFTTTGANKLPVWGTVFWREKDRQGQNVARRCGQTVRVQTKHAGVLLRKLQRAQRRKSGESRLCKHTAGESSGSANKANRRLDSKPGSPCGKANFAASSISHIPNLCVQIEVFLAGEQHVGGHASLRRCIVITLYL